MAFAARDEPLGDYVRLLGSRLRGELAHASPPVRRRAIAIAVFDAVREIGRVEDREVTGSAAFLVPLAQQIELWFASLPFDSAVAKSAEAAAVHVSPMLRARDRGASA